MSFEFSIPLSRDDLLTKNGVNQYVVDEVYPLRQLPSLMKGLHNSLRTKGAFAVLENFDVIFSVLINIHQVKTELNEETWELLLKMLSTLGNQLQEYLDGDLDPTSRQNYLNALKMNCYLVCQFMDYFEGEASKPVVNMATGKGRKKTALSVAGLGALDWETERDNAVRCLLRVLHVEIHRLWDPPIVEEDFVTLISGSCYRLLENPAVSKNKTTRETIFRVLGVLVKKYNHALSCSVKILQLLQHFEHLASPMVQAVQILATEFGGTLIIADIMREIGSMDPKELAQDTSGTRAYSAFLVELAETNPALMMPNIATVVDLLGEESYTMRNSVLAILGEMVVRLLSKGELDDRQKQTRDDFLDELEEHIHDVHAFVRSKCLQIWLNIVSENALPLPRQHALLDLVIGRLDDKSSQVRRYAVKLTTALLQSNPFAAKLSAEELKANYEKEKVKLTEMLAKQADTPQAKARKEVSESWVQMEKEVRRAVKDVLARTAKEDEEEGEAEDDGISTTSSALITDDDDVNMIRSRIVEQLTSGHLEEAVKLYLAGKEAFSGDAAFSTQPIAPAQRPDAEEGEAKEEHQTDPASEILCGLEAIHAAETLLRLAKEMATGGDVSDVVQSQVGSDTLDYEIAKQQVLVQFLKDSMMFVVQLQKALPVVCQLLGSKNNTDVLEAIELFVTAFEFSVVGAMAGVRRMLVLVWSKEQAVKEAVVEAYRRLFIHSATGNARAKALAVANNLIALTAGATVGCLTSLEELVCELVRSGDLEQKVIQVMWERFAMKIPNTAAAESRGCLVLLGMAAGAQPEIVKSNVEVLVKEGLGPRAEEDFLLVRDTCNVLLKLVSSSKVRGGELPAPFKFPKDHQIFQRLAELLTAGVKDLQKRHWIPMAEQAVNVIYKLAEHPDVICGDVIKRLAAVVVAYGSGGDSVKQEEAGAEGEAPGNPDDGNPSGGGDKDSHGDNGGSQGGSSQGDTAPGPSCPSLVLARLLSLAGHVALCHLVHLDVAVFGELKRRRGIQEQETTAGSTGTAQRPTVPPSASRRPPKPSDAAEPSMEDELGMAGAAAEDEEAEYIRRITEGHVVTGDNLLAALAPLLVAVCSNASRYPDPDLRAAASLALSKYMLVSSEFCEAHLQLLFTILEKSPHPVIRANTIIALGDLTVRFPNLIEPWTANIYARLRDPSPMVRKNTLMVLTHLILNDMVKVKGQISEMATCIVDEDTCIANRAKLFFHELAKKGNTIYNIMPDMISRLSDTEVGVPEDHFRTIMEYTFSFIQKDRQCESLVEKLCHRFRATRVERQWRDLAYCLSMLTYSDKSVRKLQENFACFADKLFEEQVYSSFVSLLSGAKQLAKPELETLVAELEERVEQCHAKGVEDDEASQKASKAAATARLAKGKTAGKTPGRRGGRGRGRTPARGRARAARGQHQSFSGGDGDSDDEAFQPAQRKTRKTAKPKLSFSSEEDDDLDLPPSDQGRRGGGGRGRTPAGGRARAARGQHQPFSGGDGDSDDEAFQPAQLKTRKTAKPKLSLSSDEEELDMNNFQPERGQPAEALTQQKTSDAGDVDTNITDASPLLSLKKRHKPVASLRTPNGRGRRSRNSDTESPGGHGG